MNEKKNINNRNIKKIFLYVLITINIIGIYFLYHFIDYYIIRTFNTSAEELISENITKSDGLNTKSFDKIIKTVEKKSKQEDFSNNKIKNIFN